ncbi:McrB family protein [Paratractidigestivibacter sp.]|uniref:McrB family protein n=1 Tax=Paratractidigestivibacter sp. TaxID=2847316 RepID=UPI002ACB1463|nr:AAA family ATPase [Paratractidigestivibacter sp.]
MLEPNVIQSSVSGAEREQAFVEWLAGQDYKDKYKKDVTRTLAGYMRSGQLVAQFLGTANAFEVGGRAVVADAYEAIKSDNTNVTLHYLPSAALSQYEKFLGELESGSSAETTTDNDYGDAEFLADVYVETADLDDMKELLRRKKNLILQGAPGTGKTYAARRLAWCLMGEKDDGRILFTQFHQSSSYDEFVIGYRPDGDGGFEVAEGVFVEFADKAAADPGRDYFLIIDEINRANVSKVLGELLMLIEADHRGDTVRLSVGGREFSVPANLYIIGMMNTADRGLALIDYALRRRFAFFEMEPALAHPSFRASIAGNEKMVALVGAVEKLNEVIASDPALGSGFRIGHSYFCDANADARLVVRYELAPLVREYWFDDAKKADDEIEKLRAAVK